jgi:hypothetical protein
VRRALLAVAVAGLAVAAPPSRAARPERQPCLVGAWAPHVGQARAWAAHRRGTISFSVRVGGRQWGWRERRAVPTASVLKALLLVAYLRQREVARRPLGAGDRALLAPMIRRSDNVAATRVRDIVTSAGLERLGRAAHLPSLRVAAIWGLSRLNASDASRFFLHLPELVPRRHRACATWLLAHVVASQRWGIGQVPLPAGWRLLFKGGWGSGTGAVDHQVALLLGRCGARVAIAVMTTADATHADGQASLRGVFARLLRGLPEQRGAQRLGVDAVDAQQLVAGRLAAHDGHRRARDAGPRGDEPADRRVRLAVDRRGGDADDHGAGALADDLVALGAGLDADGEQGLGHAISVA